mmetsp:Transcript_19965/g.46847  ORF Transcript_19965/g.46847 Transcript_19965/m.46847 type:complete len:210 (-) Transcript_19965:103-732(-)
MLPPLPLRRAAALITTALLLAARGASAALAQPLRALRHGGGPAAAAGELAVPAPEEAELGNGAAQGARHAEVPFRRDGSLRIVTQDSRTVETDLEVPDSYQDFMQGLMYRSSFCDRCSMLFAWSRDGDRPFWMKDTWIPLDMVWVNHEGVIVDIKQAKADDLSSVRNDHPAQYVFEFRENWCRDHGVRVGDAVSWTHESQQPAFAAPDF